MDNVKNKKIGILGAGISGLSAGIVLAKNGYEVEIFEKRPRAGSFFEKDVHSLRNYLRSCDALEEYKKLGIKISNFRSVFKELRFSADGKSVEIYSEKTPLFYNVIRGCSDKKSLDNELLEQAKSCGAKVFFSQNKNISDGDIDIVAVGAQEPRGVAFGAHYEIKSGNIDYIIHLTDDLAPNGYIYALPFFNELSLVIATAGMESKKELENKFNLLRSKNKIVKEILKNAEFKNEIYGFAYFDLPKTAIKDGKIYIGEAAGFLDAMSGFGTHYAIISGYLAAKSIINNENYDELWKQYFGEELENRFKKRIEAQKIKGEAQDKKIEEILKKFGNKIPIEEYKKYL